MSTNLGSIIQVRIPNAHADHDQKPIKCLIEFITHCHLAHPDSNPDPDSPDPYILSLLAADLDPLVRAMGPDLAPDHDTVP
jgi:hypothetical protein